MVKLLRRPINGWGTVCIGQLIGGFDQGAADAKPACGGGNIKILKVADIFNAPVTAMEDDRDKADQGTVGLFSQPCALLRPVLICASLLLVLIKYILCMYFEER
tara:strand:+ start:4944 stop:5255 length:312 start_codon:yes stop_codon:yes gene_type:complete